MQNVVLPCVSRASPTPTITWRKVNGSFPSTTRTLQDGGNLTIARLVREDEGFYECLATNPVAVISTTTLLLIEVTNSHGPQNVTVETTYHSATISWHPAYDEGHSVHQLLWYRRLHVASTLSINSTETSLPVCLWSTLEIIPNDTATMTLHDLEENSSYEFYIQSRFLRNNVALNSETILTQTKNRMEMPWEGAEQRRLSPFSPSPSRSVTDSLVERHSTNAYTSSSADLGVSGRVSSEVVAYGVLGLAFAIIVATLCSGLVVVLSLRRTLVQRKMKRSSRKQNNVRYENAKYYEENHKEAADSISQQQNDSVLVQCRDSLMTSVMDDVVDMLTHDLCKDTDGLAFRRFHLEAAV